MQINDRKRVTEAEYLSKTTRAENAVGGVSLGSLSLASEYHLFEVDRPRYRLIDGVALNSVGQVVHECYALVPKHKG